MYIIKYAFKNITRSLGRNILIGIIVFIIAVSSCVAMSIRRASQIANSKAMDSMSITAHIYVDRQYAMKSFTQDQGKTADEMKDMLSELRGLTLEELQVYAEADSVDDFYYYSSVSLNSDDLESMSANGTSGTSGTPTDSTGTGQTGVFPGPGGDMPQPGAQDPNEMLQQMVNQGDFMLKGYVSDASMEDFRDKTCYITEGAMFEENTEKKECIVNDELATYNSVSVGDTITFCNPNNEDETYSFEVVGIYKNTSIDSSSSTISANDPANTVITSYAVISDIEANSSELNGEDAQETLRGTVSGTYVLPSIDAYDKFESEARELGLEEKYTITSNDVATFEASLVPLENLKNFATAFLYITLLIGAIVLVVISIINIRDRKYEIGSLAAMGLKKLKLSAMFITEILTVTLVAILIGCAVGSAISVPVTNSLLQTQVEQQKASDEQAADNFGREMNVKDKPKGGDVEGEVEYVSTVEFSTDYSVILKIIGIGVLLSFVSAFASLLVILRYDPKQILANRD